MEKLSHRYGVILVVELDNPLTDKTPSNAFNGAE
jgi:hypothetical protein